MTEPNLEALLSKRGRRRQFSPDVAAARKAEMMRRSGAAASFAKTALCKLHPDDFQALYEQAKVMVNTECGPLPGDEVAS